MFSFAQSMGMGTWGLYSFYLASPLNLLVVFFDETHVVLFIWLIVAVKLGLTEMSMVFFLRRRFRLSGPLAAMFGLAVAFGTWTMSNLRNPMWLDNLILLPLICWATYRFINHGRWRMLVVLLGASVIVCWYTAYMTFFFLVFYAILEQMALSARTGTRFRDNDLWRKVLGMVGCGVLALLLSMWTFLPTIQAQVSSQGAMSSRVRGYVAQAWQMAGELVERFLPMLLVLVVLVALMIIAAITLSVMRRRTHHTDAAFAHALPCTYAHTTAWRVCVALFVAGSLILAFALARIPALAHIWELGTRTDLKGLLLGFTPTAWQEELIPQLLAGFMVTVLAIVFFVLPSIALSVRKTAAVILVFTLASTWLIPLEMLWCGLRYPKGFYSRPAMYAVFLMVLLASAACRELFAGRLPWKLVSRGEAASPRSPKTAISEDGIGFGALETNATVGTSPVTATDAVSDTTSMSSRWARALTALIVIIVITEFIVAANHTFTVVYRDYPQSHAASYAANSRAQARRLEELDGGVYRFEKNYTRANLGALNEGMVSGFRQLAFYSSANNSEVVDFLAALGYSQNDENLTRYAAPSLLSDSLLGVKYVSLSGTGMSIGPDAGESDDASSGSVGTDSMMDPLRSATQPSARSGNATAASRTPDGSLVQSSAQRSQVPQYLGMTRVLEKTGAGAEAVYRNPNALPLAYGVPAGVGGSTMPKSADPFENQNAFASVLTGHTVTPFKQVETKATDNPDGTRTWTVQVPEGSVGYVYVATQATVGFGLSIDGGATITENNRFEHALHPLAGPPSESASAAAGQSAAAYAAGTHTVTLSSPTGAPVTADQPAATCLFAVLDMNEVQSITRGLARNPLAIEQFEDGHIHGTFETSGSGTDSDAQYLLVTTAYSKGWHVTVNGVKVAAQPAFGGAVTVIPVQPGRNIIDMRFIAPGLIPGTVITAVAVLCCIGAASVVTIRRKRR